MKKIFTLCIGLIFAFSPQYIFADARPDAIVKTADGDEDLTPNDPSDLTVKWDNVQKAFSISFTTPTKGYYFDWNSWTSVEKPLTSLTKVVVEYRDASSYSNPWVTVKTYDNPELGKSYSFIDNTAPKGINLIFRVLAYIGSESSDGNATVSAFGGVKPGQVTDVKAVTTLGAEPVQLTFKAPSVTADGQELTSLSKIRIYGQYYDYSKYENVEIEYGVITPVTPGQSCSFEIKNQNLSDGRQTVYITAIGDEGSGEPLSHSFYIGIDYPGLVTDLKAKEQADGKWLVSWKAPELGSNGGYFDPSNLKYKINVQGDAFSYPYPVLSSDLTECQYLYTPDFDEPTIVKFGVSAYNAKGSSSEALTSEIIISDALQLPFSETFNAQVNNGSYTSYASDHLWSSSNNAGERYSTWKIDSYTYTEQGEQVKPDGGEGAMAYIRLYNSNADGSYNYNSQKISVESKSNLELSFSYWPVGDCDMSLESSVAFDGSEPVTVHKVSFKDASESSKWVSVSKTVSVPAGAKNAVLTFSAVKSGSKVETIAIDGVSLREAGQAQNVYPASVSDFKAVYNKSENNITVTGTAPTLSHPSLGTINDQPLTYITCIKLWRRIGMGTDDVLVHTWTPSPGEKIEYVDNDITEYGEYSYKAVVYVDDYCDYGQFLDNPVMVGQIPIDINDLTITTDKGQAPVTLKFTVPATDREGEALDKVLKITVERYDADALSFVLLDELTDELVPGEVRIYQDNQVVSGETYQYRLIVYGTAGNTLGTLKSVYVGIDQPVQPANVKAFVNERGKVTVTWDTPTTGINDGYIDVEGITYTVQRGNGYSDYDAVQLKGNISGNTYEDETVFEDEEAVKYFVKATSLGITGYSGISNVLVVGQPSKLPFTENFEAVWDGNISADHTTWTMEASDGGSVWAFAELAYSMYEGQIMPQDGRGLAYAYYGPASAVERDDYLISGNIDVEGVETPTVDFWVYAIPGYDAVLALDVAFDRGNYDEVHKIDYKDWDKEEWTLVSCPLKAPEDAEILSIRFHAHKGSNSCSVIVDNIRVYDKETGVSGNLTGKLDVTSRGGEIIVKGAADAQVSIVNVYGVTVASHRGDFSKAVTPGIYIVKAPGYESVKIAVE